MQKSFENAAEGLCKSSCEDVPRNLEREENMGGPMFCPPLYKQRYCSVATCLQQKAIKRVADFGCSECKVMVFLREIPGIELISGVDIDRETLASHSYMIKPRASDFLSSRSQDLHIRLFAGSVTNYDSRLAGAEAVTMIEVIEHLEPDVLEAFPPMVFGRLRPKYVIITTPNQEFNVLFPNFTGFRHWDHKFEWTRDEFCQWCERVCQKHGYTVEFQGVGEPPADQEHLGHCSQMAVFTLVGDMLSAGEAPEEQEEPYELLASSVYPARMVSLSQSEYIVMQAEYQLRMLAKTRLEERDRQIEAEYDRQDRISGGLTKEHPSDMQVNAQGNCFKDTDHLEDEKVRGAEVKGEDSLDTCNGAGIIVSEGNEFTNSPEESEDTQSNGWQDDSGFSSLVDLWGRPRTSSQDLSCEYDHIDEETETYNMQVSLSYIMGSRQIQEVCDSIDSLREALRSAGYEFSEDTSRVVFQYKLFESSVTESQPEYDGVDEHSNTSVRDDDPDADTWEGDWDNDGVTASLDDRNHSPESDWDEDSENGDEKIILTDEKGYTFSVFIKNLHSEDCAIRRPRSESGDALENGGGSKCSCGLEGIEEDLQRMTLKDIHWSPPVNTSVLKEKAPVCCCHAIYPATMADVGGDRVCEIHVRTIMYRHVVQEGQFSDAEES